MQMLDLFSGIGGFHKGFAEAGWEFDWIGFSEIDKHASSVYRYRYPEAVEIGDITVIRPERDLPDKLTVLCGGFPCQSFSIAGARGSFSDTRGTLFFEIARILSYYRDKGDPVPYFLLENVKGLYSAGDYTAFATIYGVLAELGYNVECSLENTKYYLPQNRERIYIAGYIGDRGRGQIFPLRKDDKTFKRKGEKESENCTTLTARYHKMGDTDTYIADYRTDEGLRIRSDNVSPCLNSVKASETEPSWMPPLTMEIDQTKIRRLTPNECERRQGFSTRNDDGTWDDGWTSTGMVDGEVVNLSDTQRYKMCGNAVTVPVVRAIAAKILMTKGCDHSETEYQPSEPDNSVIEGLVCVLCGEDLQLKDADWDEEGKELIF